MKETENAYRIFVGKPIEQRPLGRARSKTEDNIKICVMKFYLGDGRWMELDLYCARIGLWC
jgi:hypothetical protein